MKHNLKFIDQILTKIKNENLYRDIKYGINNNTYVIINKKKLINLCSNNYLGLKTKKIIINKIESNSRSIYTDPIFKILEEKLADHKNQGNALIYPTGYMANMGAISSIINNNDIILSDELNHASIIDACKLTNAKIVVYKHNDINDLISKSNIQHKHGFIITEGIFSMDGDFSKLKQITEIAEKKNLVVILDDAHGDFVIGNNGKGTANHFGLDKKIDVYISSLSKGLGAFGGYVASQKNVIKLCINKSKQFIYTSTLPSMLIQIALQKFIIDKSKYQIKLYNNTKLLINNLKKIGYAINSETHIVPIIIGKEKKALEFSNYLFKNGIYVIPIRYPTVPKNKARLRVSINASLSKNQINYITDVFETAIKKFNIISD